MNLPGKYLGAMTLVLLTGFAAGIPLHAEDPPKEGWSDVADFSYVMTAGNSETSTLGFKNLLKKTWDKSSFEIRAGAIRAKSTTKTYELIAPDDVNVEKTTATTAENYYLNGRYDRKITDKFFWYAGAGWDRNQFAGINNRYAAMGGVGNIWYDTEKAKFRTDYALSYTKQEDVVDNPDTSDNFMGARFSSNFQYKIGTTTTYGNDFIVDENLDDTSDLRGDMTNWLAVTMTENLALKVSLQWLYDNQPSLVEVPDPGDAITPGVVDVTELDSLDTIFTASLVVKF